MKKPNIILIMCDQMRGDCLGVSGHPDVKTPYLDSLANDGTLFTASYSATPSCVPARAGLFTGQSQKKHGRVGYQDGVDWNYSQMLPQIISDNGYETAAIGKLHAHPPLNKCGFNSLELHDGYIGYYRNPENPYYHHQKAHDSYLKFLKKSEGYDADVADHGLECNSWVARPWLYSEMSHPTNWVTSQSISFLELRDRQKPFFLMASFVRPHPPLDAPAPYFDMYSEKSLAPSPMGDWVGDPNPADQNPTYCSPYGTPDLELQRQAKVGYYACITHMDHQIGRLLKVIDQENLLEDSIIIFTSDHGELLFDHGLFRKVQPYQGSVQIPLIIRVGKNIRGENQLDKVSSLAELRDLAPTILDFSGIDIPESMDGISLKPAMFTGDDTREYIHGEHSGGLLSNHFIVTKTDKFVWFSQTGIEQYFNLDTDPKEKTNLINDTKSSDRTKKLRALLIKELEDREEGYSNGENLIVGRRPQNLLTKNINGCDSDDYSNQSL